MEADNPMSPAQHYDEAESLLEQAVANWFTDKERLAAFQVEQAKVHAMLAMTEAKVTINNTMTDPVIHRKAWD